MKALIDSIFNPVIDWLNSLQATLMNASVPLSQQLPITDLFAPIAMISPSWALVITNIFAMAFIYAVIYIVSNGTGIIERFRNSVKWW